jgi:allophanate hydrolase subunit 1
MQSITINGKTYCKIHELTIEIDRLNNESEKVSVEEIKNLLLGINSLAVELENEFIYRGDLLRQMADILEKYGWKKVIVPEPSEN